MARKRHKGGHDDHEEHVDEAWLVSYADMMTLLVALFMVLFSISSVNKSKFESLQRALQEAFSGRVLPGGQGLKENGGTDNIKTPSSQPQYSSLQQYMGGRPEESSKDGKAKAAKAAAAEDRGFKELKKRIEAAAAAQGISGKVQARITEDGLKVRILTDDLLFDSGSATVKPESVPLLGKVGTLLAAEARHPVLVEGHTDTVPVRTGRFPSNWELSANRASSVVRTFAASGVRPGRMTASGRAYLQPVGDNASAAGRSLNRRVEILLPRLVTAAPAAAAENPAKPTIAPEIAP